MQSHQVMPRTFLPLAAVALFLSACGDKGKDDTGALLATTDSVQASMRGDSVASVEVIPPPSTPAPTAEQPLVAGRAPAPRPAPTRPRTSTAPRPSQATRSNLPAPVGASRSSSGTIDAGSTLSVSSGAKVCTNTVTVGDRITTTTNSAVSGSNGVSIPAGARVGLVVTQAKSSGSQGDGSELAFDVRSLSFGGDDYTLDGSVSTDAIVQERKGGDGRKVAIGAAAGAVIGNVIGGGSRAQRTVVGAAAGGLAGAAAAAMTGDRLLCLPEGANLTVRLGNAVTIKNN